MIYETGRRGERFRASRRLVRKAADAGIPEAQYNLAVMYANGEGVPKDQAKANELYKKAAEKEARTRSRTRRDSGEWNAHAPKDEKQAVGYLKKAAEQAAPMCSSITVWLFLNGQGTAQILRRPRSGFTKRLIKEMSTRKCSWRFCMNRDKAWRKIRAGRAMV